MKDKEILKEINNMVQENVESKQTYHKPYNPKCCWSDIDYTLKEESKN